MIALAPFLVRSCTISDQVHDRLEHPQTRIGAVHYGGGEDTGGGGGIRHDAL